MLDFPHHFQFDVMVVAYNLQMITDILVSLIGKYIPSFKMISGYGFDSGYRRVR